MTLVTIIKNEVIKSFFLHNLLCSLYSLIKTCFCKQIEFYLAQTIRKHKIWWKHWAECWAYFWLWNFTWSRYQRASSSTLIWYRRYIRGAKNETVFNYHKVRCVFRIYSKSLNFWTYSNASISKFEIYSFWIHTVKAWFLLNSNWKYNRRFSQH